MTTYNPSEEELHEEQSVEVTETQEASGYINPYLAGILLGIVLFSAFFLTFPYTVVL